MSRLTLVQSKTCVSCESSKPVTEFYTRKRADGSVVPRGTCKQCMADASKAARLADPERFRGYQRTYQSKVSRRERALREKFNMTLEEWNLILEEQGGTCAICDGASGDPTFHGDHNHVTGDFRAILCGLCNRMLGQGQDDPARLLAGARYLQDHS